MNKKVTQEMLEKAKKDYPIGTMIKSAASEYTVVVKNSPVIHKNYNDMIATIADNNGIIYDNGKWAEIISYPKDYIKPSEELLNWEI